ncbi:hypothetical protein CS063_13300 [Sporanaerobium hydrogeniformans]|uniref:Uncharacterized protein n=1 Tax=Sporanaerobium hydrogeniformans TaxID=3072179 RepID=A0AC61DBN3_9FIRM|nr:TolC family protein [Sporanaerobium hydrogeniformans]PHV69952.1 hypothetical protein CS063_13300 [Sporanaerobium hydrogeniformans]
MDRKRRTVTLVVIFILAFNLNTYAGNTERLNENSTTTNKDNELSLTLEQAIEKGLENNPFIHKVKNAAELAALISQNAEGSKNAIYNGANELSNAQSDLSNGRATIYDSLDQLESAQAALDNGIAPQDIPIPNPATGEILLTIPKGQNIESFLEAYGLEGNTGAVIEQVQRTLDASKSQINGALETLDESTQKYISSKSKYDLAVQFAMTGVANKLSTSTISSLEPRPLADLMVEMTKVQDRITSYSVNIYKNQIALKIQNSYYEALKQEKLLEVKSKAMERGKLQYDYASYAYEVGAKSKDDEILAKTYYDGTCIAYDLQEKEYKNALTTLKKDLNMALDTPIKLVESDEEKTTTHLTLTQGINSGLRTRLEIKMAQAQVELYKDLRAAVESSGYKTSDNQYKEVELLLKKAEIELENTKLEVESGIRMSYETVSTMEKVAQTAKNLKIQAEENVEIAKLKYEVGFGASNALLKSLNLEDLSGTMVEVIAAEENLASMEEKIIETTNGYKLANVKYLNDIGILPYK